MSQPTIHLMRSTFFNEEETREKLAEFIRTTSRLSMGPKCKEFEEAFASYQGRKYAVCVTSGSAANLGLIQALLNMGKLKKGDKVGVSTVTWATNVMPIMQLGMIPVAIDCSIENLNVTADILKEKIAGLDAFFLTNALGFCGDIDGIRDLCREHEVLFIEDNCESLGTVYQGNKLGNFGLASTFSCFVGHHLSTIEGGMICTDDEELYQMLIMVRAHGWDRNVSGAQRDELRATHAIEEFHGIYTFYESAYNLRPTEITGFLGTLQVPMLEATIDRRISNFNRFKESVAKQPELYYQLDVDHIERISNFAMPLICKSRELLVSTVQRFRENNVEVRPVIAGDITLHPFWKKELSQTVCAQGRIIHHQGLYFPNNPDLTEEEVHRLCSVIEANT